MVIGNRDNIEFGKTLAEQKKRLEVSDSPLGIVSIEDAPKRQRAAKLVVLDQRSINLLTSGTEAAKAFIAGF